ncbi:MAG: RDD family protein [Verrucomicrobiota bacterium]
MIHSTPENPYAPPSSPSAPTSLDSQEGASAGRIQRILNLIIDYLSVFGISYGLGLLTAKIFGYPGLLWISRIPDHLLLFCLFSLYYIVCEATTSRTVGKWITGTKVVAQGGRRPSLLQVMVRSLLRFIPLDPLTFFGKGRRGWHDSLARTYVVKSR